MRIRSFFFTLSLPALALVGSIALLQESTSPAFAADSYEKLSNYSTASLTKTIDLNPVLEEDVRSYYASLDGKSLQGEDLLKALKPILMNGQQYFNYDTNSAIWQMYEITDRDWTLSPASEITNGTYDEATGIISNYTYGTNSNKRDNPYIHCLYRNPGVEEARLHIWDHHGDNNGIDREHIWPKSRGFGKDSQKIEHTDSGARGDPHHLLPGDSYVNSKTHSNYSYGFVDKGLAYDNAGEEYKINDITVVAGNYLGTSATFGTTLGNGKVFEPQDCDKGDIARACFYMVARYNNLAGDDDTIDAGNPNLFLSDESISTDTVMSDKDNPVSIGILRDLLAWHKMDPVDDYEIYRDDLIYRNYGKNRNPFIDFPEWVDYVWGTVEIDNSSRKVTSYDRVPTGTAKPSQDTLTRSSYSPISPVVSITAENAKTTHIQAENFEFGGKVIATREDNSKSDITKLCSFSGYNMSTLGEQNVTVTYSETVKTTYPIHVYAIDSLTVKEYKESFVVGDAFSFGGKVIASVNGADYDVTKSCTFSDYDMSKQGKQTVTVTHPSGAKTTYSIVINAKPGIPLPVMIGVGIGAAIALLILIIVIRRGPTKVRRSAKRMAKSAAKAAPGSRNSRKRKK